MSVLFLNNTLILSKKGNNLTKSIELYSTIRYYPDYRIAPVKIAGKSCLKHIIQVPVKKDIFITSSVFLFFNHKFPA